MAVLRYIVPALAVASGAAAQFGQASSSLCSTSATLTVTSQAQATQYASCQKFQGSIQVAAETTDNIDLSGISIITGDLVANNASSMSQLSSSSLSVIGGEFHLNGLIDLATLSFPSLVRVRSIWWRALPSLGGLSFNQGVQELQNLDIENTGLASLEGIDLESADTIMIVNNLQLKDITMQLGNVTESLVIGNNNQALSVSFPNLIWANNITLRGCESLSTPSLSSINGSYGIYTSGFSSYSAPNLTDVGGALSFVSNPSLSNISLPELTTIGQALYIVNDTSLASVDGFPALKTVSGNIFAKGTFNNITLPSLQNVRGSFNVSSTGNITDSCNHFKSISGTTSSIIKGTFQCFQIQQSSSSSGSSGSSGSGSGSGTKSAAVSLLVPGVSTVLLGVVALGFGLL